MQITGTRIAPEGQMIAVEFLGEGGEYISVVMSNADNSIDTENALQHAQALLAQVSNFGNEVEAPINRYDALSNGNLEESVGGPTQATSLDAGMDDTPSDLETSATPPTQSSKVPF
ncbi:MULTISPECIES: hypothetical protein [Rhizobium]|uniref:Uncharacterized protein n=1 Tax=Rhizobium favelukesii TaxID=348824 RepID=W6S759_9HYPH|nr:MULTISPECIES: hypothetical protein [Rhizobium]MCS0463545.1 hypothetical protein [Rhizobium favelukesii]UFS80234.1 hypothetical protein LPB79_02915 [Rhizobium sp. T136]CDM62021.1 hypothetical protein LPU83_pLPU83d_0650 [Rhizobium favelukesii]